MKSWWGKRHTRKISSTIVMIYWFIFELLFSSKNSTCSTMTVHVIPASSVELSILAWHLTVCLHLKNIFSLSLRCTKRNNFDGQNIRELVYLLDWRSYEIRCWNWYLGSGWNRISSFSPRDSMSSVNLSRGRTIPNFRRVVSIVTRPDMGRTM